MWCQSDRLAAQHETLAFRTFADGYDAGGNIGQNPVENLDPRRVVWNRGARFIDEAKIEWYVRIGHQ
ncbi:hypothetical protein D3C87_1951050 [compost metagenome]